MSDSQLEGRLCNSLALNEEKGAAEDFILLTGALDLTKKEEVHAIFILGENPDVIIVDTLNAASAGQD